MGILGNFFWSILSNLPTNPGRALLCEEWPVPSLNERVVFWMFFFSTHRGGWPHSAVLANRLENFWGDSIFSRKNKPFKLLFHGPLAE